MRSPFGARSDVFAQRWENPSSGKSGWSPVVLEGIIALQCGPTRYEITPKNTVDAVLVRRELIVHETHAEVTEEESSSIEALFGSSLPRLPASDSVAAETFHLKAVGARR